MVRNNMRALLNYEAALARAQKCRTMKAALAVIDAWAREEFKDRRRKVTPTVQEKILQMYRAGENYYAIADAVGMSYSGVKSVVYREVPPGERHYAGTGRPANRGVD